MKRMLHVGWLIFFAGAPWVGAEELKVLPSDMTPAPGRMMDAYLRAQAYEAFERRAEAYERIETIEDVHAYQERMRTFFIEQIGGFPERTPLNPRTVGRGERDGYRYEKVIFESQPGHHVTAILFLPVSEPPYPGVIVPCGHAANGKGSELYQRASILLARHGMAALLYDPIGQGERNQLLNEEGKRLLGSTQEHTLVGQGCIPLGFGLARYRIWDGMRAIDYLQQRDDIDAERIGCTGNSGGGTLTSYLMALDDRIRAAAASCYLTTLHRLIDTIGAQDAEQNIHAQIAFGMDHADYVMMRAPSPVLICAATRDYFDITGTWDTYRQAKRLYGRLGFPERVDLVETDAQHGFSELLRVGAGRWLNRWLMGRDEPITESDATVLSDEEVQCTPAGQVMLLEGARSVIDLNVEHEAMLAVGRRALWANTPREAMLEKVREIAGVRALADLPDPEHERIGEVARNGYRIEKLVLRPEAGIVLPALLFTPAETTGEPYLYLHGEGKHVDAAPGGPIEALVGEGHIVLAVDLRAIGETDSATGSRGWQRLFGMNWKDYFLAYMLGRSYVGMRTEDTLAGARFLGAHGADGRRPVHLVAIGKAGVPALHAAALEPGLFRTVRLERSLQSWRSVVDDTLREQQLTSTIHGALKVYDLPDLADTLPTGMLTLVEPLDGR